MLRLELAAVTNGVSALSFRTAIGRLYGVDYATNLAQPNPWFAVADDVVGTGAPASLSHAADGDAQFYRLRVRLSP